MAHGRAKNKYRVKLTVEEQQTFKALIREGRAPGWKLRRARALLKCDEGEGGPGWKDVDIAGAFDVTTRSLENWRKQAVERGPLSLANTREPLMLMNRREKVSGTNAIKLSHKFALACDL